MVAVKLQLNLAFLRKMFKIVIILFVLLNFSKSFPLNFTTLMNQKRVDCFIDSIEQELAVDSTGRYHDRDFYCALFLQIRRVNLNLLEIGIGCGHHINGTSPLLWTNYFHNGRHYAIDYLPHNENEAAACLSNLKRSYPLSDPKKSKTVFLQEVIKDYKARSLTFDVIIDDNGHNFRQIQATIIELWPQLSYGGIYVIEDLNMGPGIS
jgi:hypothetical protein